MKKLELEKEIIDNIVGKYKNGMSTKKIAKEIGYSYTLIINVLKQTGEYQYGNDIVLNKTEENYDYELKCKKTGKIFDSKSTGILRHIKSEYPDYKIESKFKRKEYEYKTGKRWHHEFFDRIEIQEEKESKKCKYCDWKTFDLDNKSGAYTTHLLEEHKKTTNDYVLEFPEEKWLFKTFFDQKERKEEMLSDEKNFIVCAECGEKMKKVTHTHLVKHGMTLKEYRSKHGTTLSETSMIKFVENYNKVNREIIYAKKENTKPEMVFANKLTELHVPYQQQYNIGPFFFDFKLDDFNFPIEIDGVYWHGHDREEDWTISVVNNTVNDYKKSKYLKHKLRRIVDSSLIYQNINQISSFDSLINFIDYENKDIRHHRMFNLKEKDLIISKEKIQKGVLNIDMSEKLIQSLIYLWKEFYNPNNHVNFIDLDTRKKAESKLKGVFFEGFHKAKKEGNKDLFELFKDDKLLKKVVIYRLGLNDAKEYFDINLKNLYRGIEVRTMFNVGILPVKLAVSVYDKFLDKTSENNIFDPFAGWASRAIAVNKFDNINSKYTGYDTNYNIQQGYEYILDNMIKNDKIKIEIKNSTVFNEELTEQFDFIFTSPPFFNDELYHDQTYIYSSLDDWKEKLLIPVFKNCYNYLKGDKYMVIDMKQKYNDSIIESAEMVGFKYIGIEEYNVQKSHYATEKKVQNLITFKKQ